MSVICGALLREKTPKSARCVWGSRGTLIDSSSVVVLYTACSIPPMKICTNIKKEDVHSYPVNIGKTTHQLTITPSLATHFSPDFDPLYPPITCSPLPSTFIHHPQFSIQTRVQIQTCNKIFFIPIPSLSLPPTLCLTSNTINRTNSGPNSDMQQIP